MSFDRRGDHRHRICTGDVASARLSSPATADAAILSRRRPRCPARARRWLAASVRLPSPSVASMHRAYAGACASFVSPLASPTMPRSMGSSCVFPATSKAPHWRERRRRRASGSMRPSARRCLPDPDAWCRSARSFAELDQATVAKLVLSDSADQRGSLLEPSRLCSVGSPRHYCHTHERRGVDGERPGEGSRVSARSRSARGRAAVTASRTGVRRSRRADRGSLSRHRPTAAQRRRRIAPHGLDGIGPRFSRRIAADSPENSGRPPQLVCHHSKA